MRLRPFTFVCAAAIAVLAANEPTRAAEQPSGPAQHKTTQSVSYVIIEPIYASILEGSRSRGLLLVEFGLDIPDEGLRNTANRVLPMLRDAYVRSLLAYAATTVRPWRQPSVEDIANRLQSVTDKTLGKEGARVLMAQTAIRLTR